MAGPTMAVGFPYEQELYSRRWTTGRTRRGPETNNMARNVNETCINEFDGFVFFYGLTTAVLIVDPPASRKSLALQQPAVAGSLSTRRGMRQTKNSNVERNP